MQVLPGIALATAVLMVLSLGGIIFLWCCRKRKVQDKFCVKLRRCKKGEQQVKNATVEDRDRGENRQAPKVMYNPWPVGPPSSKETFTGPDFDKMNSEDGIYAEIDSLWQNLQASSRGSDWGVSLTKASSAHKYYTQPSCSFMPKLSAKGSCFKQNQDEEGDHIYLVPPLPVSRQASKDEYRSVCSRVIKRKGITFPSRYRKTYYAEVVQGPLLHQPGHVDSELLKHDITKSDDDLFKDAWWKSTQSLATGLLDDDESAKYFLPSDPPSRNRMTSEMALRTSLLCKMGTSEEKIQSPTYLLRKADISKSQGLSLPCLSFWSESVPGGLEVTAELRAPPSRPCTINDYVNFKDHGK